MKIVILTGGIGSGKTYVSKIFNELFKVPIFNTDEMTKLVMTNDFQVQEDLVELLGNEMFLKNGELDKKYIGDKIFNDNELRNKIENIVHPAVHKLYEQFIACHNDKPYVIVECAIFFSLKNHGEYKHDYVIGVFAETYKRIERIKNRSNWDDAKINNVINMQMSNDELMCKCDFVVNNTDDGWWEVSGHVIDINKQIIS